MKNPENSKAAPSKRPALTPNLSMIKPAKNPPMDEPMLLQNERYDESIAEKLHLFISWGEYTPYKYGVPEASAATEQHKSAIRFEYRWDGCTFLWSPLSPLLSTPFGSYSIRGDESDSGEAGTCVSVTISVQ